MEPEGKHSGTAEGQPGKTIETASATTSPENSDSGNGAYVLVAVVLLVLLLLSSSVASCTSQLVEGYLPYSDGYPEAQPLEPDDGYGLGDGYGDGLGDGEGYGYGNSLGGEQADALAGALGIGTVLGGGLSA